MAFSILFALIIFREISKKEWQKRKIKINKKLCKLKILCTLWEFPFFFSSFPCFSSYWEIFGYHIEVEYDNCGGIFRKICLANIVCRWCMENIFLNSISFYNPSSMLCIAMRDLQKLETDMDHANHFKVEPWKLLKGSTYRNFIYLFIYFYSELQEWCLLAVELNTKLTMEMGVIEEDFVEHCKDFLRTCRQFYQDDYRIKKILDLEGWVGISTQN